MSRFFVPKDSVKGSTISVSGEEAHHIADVMRLAPGDRVVTFDGTGKEYSGVIRSVGKKELLIEITDTRSSAAPAGPRVTLIQSITKKEKIEYIIEKATELGVDSIVPVFTERTVPEWNTEKRSLHLSRWRKLATEASKQCGRIDIPGLCDIADFTDVARDEKLAGLKLIAALQNGSVALKKALSGSKDDRIYIAIGPEGDFTPAEIKTAVDSGFKLVSLGARVLKSDTAGLFALSAIGYEYSE